MSPISTGEAMAVTKVEMIKTGDKFIVRSHILTPRLVRVPVFSNGKPLNESREMTQMIGEVKEEFFTDEKQAQERHKALSVAVSNV